MTRPRERGNPTLRALDRAVGVPIVVGAGAFRRRRPLPPEPKRVGIVNSTNIGDTVLLSAVARDVAAAFGDADVVLFAQSAANPLIELVAGVRGVELAIVDPRHAISTIRKERLDVLLDFDPWPRIEAIYGLLSRARFTAGFRAPGQHKHHAFDAFVDHLSDVHELENFRRLASVLGVESRSLPRFEPPRAERPTDRPYVVFHLWPSGYRSELKEWPQEHWATLARAVAERGRTVVLTGSSADAARTAAFVGSLPDVDGNVVDVAGRYGLSELLGVLAQADCVVSVNTGVMHIAAAVGAPTVALNGPTSSRRWGPIGPRAASVDSSFAGCGFLNLGWEYRRRRADCMRGIEPERVLAVVENAFDEVRGRTVSPAEPELR